MNNSKEEKIIFVEYKPSDENDFEISKRILKEFCINHLIDGEYIVFPDELSKMIFMEAKKKKNASSFYF